LQRRNLKRGIAALCLGGGNAVALAVERSLKIADIRSSPRYAAGFALAASSRQPGHYRNGAELVEFADLALALRA